MDLLLILSQTILVLGVIYFIYKTDKREKNRSIIQSRETNDLHAKVIMYLTQNSNEYYKSVEQMQKEFFKDVSASSYKSVYTLEKITTKMVELANRPNKPETVIREEVVKTDNFKMVNDIEKEDEVEYELADSPRIPIVSGVNLKFEDENEIYPINITSAESNNVDMESLMGGSFGSN